MTKLLTIAEVAEALSLSESTVRGLCSSRKLRHERHGAGRGTIRIPPDALDQYRAAVTVSPAREETPEPEPTRRRAKADEFTDYYRKVMAEVARKRR
jgi:excisionase family DNA binding protein